LLFHNGIPFSNDLFGLFLSFFSVMASAMRSRTGRAHRVSRLSAYLAMPSTRYSQEGPAKGAGIFEIIFEVGAAGAGQNRK
jgi:hypothetical protein